jgi:cytoskeletal protein RodZ
LSNNFGSGIAKARFDTYFRPEMSTVAEQLRQAREARKLTIQEVAEATKIRSDHVQALDEGNWEVFPAPVYIRGFVRTYAGFLKLDVAALIDQLNTELSKSDKHREHPQLSPKPRSFVDTIMYQLSKVNWRIALPVFAFALLTLIAVYVFRFWSEYKAKDPLRDLGPGLHQPAEDKTGDTLPIPPAPRR